MVSFLNTSRNSNLKIPNTKHENGDLIIYCSIPATTHRQRPTGIRVAARGNIIDKKYGRITSIPATYRPYAMKMTSRSQRNSTLS